MFKDLKNKIVIGVLSLLMAFVVLPVLGGAVSSGGYGSHIASAVGVHLAYAAVDTQLQDALATSTTYMTDNKSMILGYIVGLILLVFALKFAKRGVIWGTNFIMGLFGRGRGGRRR